MSAPVSEGLALSRRGLLAAGGAFVLSFDPLRPLGAQTPPRLPGSLNSNRRLDAWLRIHADGTVTLMTGKVELGQGILTALSQICAEELDVDLGRLRVFSGDTAVTPNEGTTAGSQSMQFAGTAVQYAAAEMRHVLLGMAAERLGAAAAALRVADGTIRAPDGRSTTYWELLGGRLIDREASGSARPKAPADYRIVGTATPRRDLPGKMSGAVAYVQDLRFRPMCMPGSSGRRAMARGWQRSIRHGPRRWPASSRSCATAASSA